MLPKKKKMKLYNCVADWNRRNYNTAFHRMVCTRMDGIQYSVQKSVVLNRRKI